MPHRLLHLLVASFCALALGPAAPAQVAPPAARLAEWPSLKDTDKERVLALAGQFKKADADLHAAATKQLLDLGAGAAPLLFQQVSDRAENQNAQICAVLDTMLDRRHAALMARECKKPRVELRRYLIRRLCTFTDPELLPVLQAATKDKDEATAFYAALGALALQQRDAVAPVMAYTKRHWPEVGDLVAAVLPAARSQEVGEWLFAAIATAPAADQMAGLRLVRYLATKEQAAQLRRYLESADHTVKKEAVNAARVLHGEPPLENLPVFQAIELSKHWLQKL
jgi:hypothetical protein